MGHLIVKANSLIEAKYRLNLVEARLVLKLVSVIEQSDMDFKIYTFNVSELLHEFDMNTDNHKEIKNATYNLLKRAMKIKDPFAKRELQVAFLSSADYYEERGIVELCFDPKLKPYLLQLKANFTSYKFDNVKRFTRVYAIRFYELLKQYQKIGERKFNVNHLKEVLGISKDEYKQYSDLKKKVIVTAQEELQEKSDIRFDFREIKVGRKVNELFFSIKPNKVDYKTLDRKKVLKKQVRQLKRNDHKQQKAKTLF